MSIKNILEELETGLDSDALDKIVEAFDSAVKTCAQTLVEEEKGAGEGVSQSGALQESLQESRELLQEAKDEILRLQAIVEGNINDYLKEHSETLVESERYQRLSNALDQIKSAFESNGFVLNENAEYTKLESASERLLEQFIDQRDRNQSLESELQEALNKIESLEREAIFESKTSDLTDTQKEKARALVESVSFDSREEYESGLAMILENVGAPVVATLEESSVTVSKETKNPNMSKYLKELRRMAAAS